MPSEDSLAEPVPTSHFTGQQGQGPRMGLDLHLLLTLFCHNSSCQALSAMLVPSTRWALVLHRNKSLPALRGYLSPSPKPRGGGAG